MTDEQNSPISADPISGEEARTIFACLEKYQKIGIAVSGGGDSMALLHLLKDWAEQRHGGGPTLLVLTVNHGLRVEASEEARWVMNKCQALGLPHSTLNWDGEKPASGVQDAARKARYRLMIEKLEGEGYEALVVAHHREDQAETLLMRLARGSGLDGLAGMAPRMERDGFPVYRPFLGISKSRLLASLQTRGEEWLEDPSNDDHAFERVRVREVLNQLGELGIDAERLVRSSARLARARGALEEMTDKALARAVNIHGGAYADIDAGYFFDQADEIRLRMLGKIIAAFGGRHIAPQMAKLEALSVELEEHRGAGAGLSTSLGGTLVQLDGAGFSIMREPLRGDIGKCALTGDIVSFVWDGRFKVFLKNAGPAGQKLAPLGEAGLSALKKWDAKTGDIPRQALLGLPGIWKDDVLIDAPFAGITFQNGDDDNQPAEKWHIKLELVGLKMCQRDT